MKRCSRRAADKRDSNAGSARDRAKAQIRTNGNTWLASRSSRSVRTCDQLAFACDQERGLAFDGLRSLGTFDVK